MTGIELIAAERERQIVEEQYSAAHDDEHGDGALAEAAGCYVRLRRSSVIPPARWPWDDRNWKPKDRLSNMVRAGALIAAEIDRLQRCAPEPTDE